MAVTFGVTLPKTDGCNGGTPNLVALQNHFSTHRLPGAGQVRDLFTAEELVENILVAKLCPGLV